MHSKTHTSSPTLSRKFRWSWTLLNRVPRVRDTEVQLVALESQQGHAMDVSQKTGSDPELKHRKMKQAELEA